MTAGTSIENGNLMKTLPEAVQFDIEMHNGKLQLFWNGKPITLTIKSSRDIVNSEVLDDLLKNGKILLVNERRINR